MLAALLWSVNAQAAIPLSERTALLDLYTATAGASWTNSTNWNGAAGTECSWYGVACDDTGSGSHVTQLLLSSNNLTGTLPSLSGLPALYWFSVANNHLAGAIPSLSGLTALQYFDVKTNQLTGSIPSLSGSTGLYYFDLGNNQLTGAIPSLSGLTALQYFIVSNNGLTGAIPSLSGLTALQYFDIRTNQLTGAIPSLSGLTNLQYFNLGSNQLTGAIPSLSGLTKFQVINVSENRLTGAIPAAPASLVAGQSRLCGNRLIPSGDPAIDNAWTTAQGSNWISCQLKTIQTISFGSQSAKIFGAAPFVLNPLATASSALTVIYSSATPAVCTVVGSSVTLLRPGTCSIAADQPGNPSFDPAPKVTQSFMVKGTLLSASRSKIGPKQAVTFTATVTGTSPTGSVNFRDGANSIAGCASQPLITGVATCTTNTLSLGAHSIGAAYSGDGNNPGSHAQSINVTVQRSSLVPVLPLLMF